MRILLLNLTRFGDLLQTQPLIRDLVAAGHTVGLVGLEQFVGAAGLLQGVTVLPPLPGSALLRSVDEDWRQGCALFDTYAEQLRRDFAPDAVLNLTASLAGRLLARRLTLGADAPPLVGFGVDASGFGQSSGLWTAFFEASTRVRGCSPYNIVDVFRKIALPLATPVGPGQAALNAPTPAVLATVRERLRAEALPLPPDLPAGEFVAFQLGASEARRQWPVESFAALGRHLARLGVTPVLLGTAAEQHLATAYAAAGGVGINRVGQTGLPELAATLAATRLLVTNDTGTMHLAAGLGVPSLAFFLATAQPWDTGPYLAGCCCLEPALPCHPCGFGTTCPHGERCRTQIRAETAAQLVTFYLSQGRWPRSDEVVTHDEARAWLTQAEQTDAGWVRMNLVSLSGHEACPRTALLRVQRHLYSQFLDCENATDAVTTFSPPPTSLLASLPAADRAALQQSLEQADGLLRLLEEQGKLVGVMPSAGQRFLQTMHALGRVFEATPVFNALSRLWLTTTQERGDDLQRVVAFGCQIRHWLAAWDQAL